MPRATARGAFPRTLLSLRKRHRDKENDVRITPKLRLEDALQRKPMLRYDKTKLVLSGTPFSAYWKT